MDSAAVSVQSLSRRVPAPAALLSSVTLLLLALSYKNHPSHAVAIETLGVLAVASSTASWLVYLLLGSLALSLLVLGCVGWA